MKIIRGVESITLKLIGSKIQKPNTNKKNNFHIELIMIYITKTIMCIHIFSTKS